MLILVGLAIEFWYVVVGIVVLLALVGLALEVNRRRKAARPSGPRAPFFDQVAVALAAIGLTERLRRATPPTSVPNNGSINLESNAFALSIDVFTSSELAHRAELAMQAEPKLRKQVAQGSLAVRHVGRLLYIAHRRRGVIDEPALDDVARLVGRIALPDPEETVR